MHRERLFSLLIGMVLLIFGNSAAWTFAGQAKLPVPIEDDLAAATQLVRKLYKAEFDDQAPGQQLILAQQLLDESQRPGVPGDLQYVLLKMASEIFASTAESEKVVATVNRLAEQFEVDELELDLRLLERITLDPDANTKAVVMSEQCLQLVDNAVLADKLDLAEKFSALANSASMVANLESLKERTEEYQQYLQEYKSDFPKAQEARSILSSKPDDSTASLVSGRFNCLWKNDWGTGLPLIAAGSDSTLSKLAQEDISGTSEDAFQIGNGWWNYAERKAGYVRLALQNRAVFWYRTALTKQDSEKKSLLESRVTEFESRWIMIPQFASKPPATIDGKTIEDGISGSFVGVIKGSGKIWLNGRLVSYFGVQELVPASETVTLRKGDIVVVEVECRFVYRAARIAFISDDRSSYLPITKSELKNVTKLNVPDIDAEAIAQSTETPVRGRIEPTHTKQWEKYASGLEASEWFYGPQRGTFKYAFVVEPAKFLKIEPAKTETSTE